MILKLKYSDEFTMALPATSVGLRHAFRGNSLFDPDYTATGHQPMYFDQLCSATGPYYRYRVAASKIYFCLQTLGTTPAASSIRVVLFPTNDINPPDNGYPALSEMPRSRTRCGNASEHDIKIGHYSTTAAEWGRSRQAVQDSDFTGEYNTNPAKQWFWYFSMYSTDESTAITVYVSVKVTYYAIIFGRGRTSPS